MSAPPTARRSAPRSWFVTALAAVTALISVLALTASADADTGSGTSGYRDKPTVGRVRGAFADASGWSGVIARLQRQGYPVIAPANPLRSLEGDAEYIASVLAQTPGPLVVVGHSYGGAVITNAAADNPNVKALVYIDAFIPDIGEDTLHLAGEDSQLPDAIEFKGFPPFGDTDVDVTSSVTASARCSPLISQPGPPQ